MLIDCLLIFFPPFWSLSWDTRAAQNTQDTHEGKGERERNWLFYLHSCRDAHGTILFRTTNLTNILIKPENKIRRVM